jgi:hypothetical protein
MISSWWRMGMGVNRVLINTVQNQFPFTGTRIGQIKTRLNRLLWGFT